MSLFQSEKRSRLGVASKCYSTMQKLYAIEQVRNGERKASVSRAIKVPESTLRGWFKDKELLQLYEMQRNDRKFRTSTSSDSIDIIDMIDLTDSDEPLEMPLQNPHCYSSSQYKRSITPGPDMIWTQFNSQPNRESAPGLNGTQNKGLYMPYIGNPNSLSRMASYFHPNEQIVQSNNIQSAIPSSVLSSLPSNSRSLPKSTPPLFTTPALNGTKKSISQTPAALNDTKKSILLWHEKNELLIESMARKSPPTDASNNNYTTCNINFNDNIYAAVDLSIQRNALDQPVKCGVGSKTSPESKSESQFINSNKKTPTTTASNDNFNNNNISTAVDLNTRRIPVDQPRKGAVRLSTPKTPKTKSSDSILKKQSALSSELFSLNKNYMVDEKGNDSGIMKSSEALQHAEMFGKWFETYSDPTITTQDFLRFEQLISKVRKLVK